MPINSNEYQKLFKKLGGLINQPVRSRSSELYPLRLVRIQKTKGPELYDQLFAKYPLPIECDISKFTQKEKKGIALRWKHSYRELNEKIQFAAMWGFTAYLDKLLEENTVDINKCAALYHAALHGRLETMRYLVEQRNANVNYYDGGFLNDLPLIGAIFKGDVNCVKYLLEKGASLEARGEFSNNAIEQCIALIDDFPTKKLFAILKELIRSGASLDGYWPFHETTPRAFLEKIQHSNPKFLKHFAEILSVENASLEAVDAELVASSNQGLSLKRHKPRR